MGIRKVSIFSFFQALNSFQTYLLALGRVGGRFVNKGHVFHTKYRFVRSCIIIHQGGLTWCQRCPPTHFLSLRLDCPTTI